MTATLLVDRRVVLSSAEVDANYEGKSNLTKKRISRKKRSIAMDFCTSKQ